MQSYVSFQTGEYNLAIEPAIRHTVATCKEISDGDRVERFIGGMMFAQAKLCVEARKKPLDDIHTVKVEMCPRCYCPENYNKEYIDSGGQIDGLAR